MKKSCNSRRLTRTALGVLVTAGMFGASAAQAGYFVATDANTGGGYNRGCAATYNYGSYTGAKFILNDGSDAPCAHPATSFNNQAITDTGTLDTTGKRTSSTDQSTVTSLAGSYAAAASASADLATGKVHLYAGASGPLAGAIASAELNDTLHFTVAGASANTVTYLPVSFAFDGKTPTSGDVAHANGDLSFGFSFGNGYANDVNGTYEPSAGFSPFAYVTAPSVGGWVSSSFMSYLPTDTRFTGVYEIIGASAVIPLDFRLELDAANVVLDFANTGSVSIGKVAGVSFTSDSGVFLTGNPIIGGVPEPASWALIMVGFGVVGAAVRRRRVTVAA